MNISVCKESIYEQANLKLSERMTFTFHWHSDGAILSSLSATHGRYFTPSINGAESNVKSLYQDFFASGERQSIFPTSETRDRAMVVLEAKTLLTTFAKHVFSYITNSHRPLANKYVLQ